MTLAQRIITIALCVAGTMLPRFPPFLVFSPKKPTPPFVRYLGKALPSAIFGMLVVYCLKDVSFLVTRGQKIALVGNEQAATALFRILAEEIQPDSGHVKWGVTISTSYFPKDNSPYFDGCDLNMMQWFAQYSPEQLETYMRGFLGRMLFSGDDVYKPVSVLSGGERVRCMLSRMMLSGANFLMLDQPTNHLDLESITAVNNGLISFPGNVIFTCQDHQFISTVADRILEIQPDGTVKDYLCGYEEYLEKTKA